MRIRSSCGFVWLMVGLSSSSLSVTEEVIRAGQDPSRSAVFSAPFIERDSAIVYSLPDARGIGDFDGDGFGDIVMSVVWGERDDAEKVAVVIFGGPDRSGRQTISRELKDILVFRDESENGSGPEGFVDVGDINEDGADDFFLSSSHSQLEPEHAEGMSFLILGNPDVKGEHYLSEIGDTIPGVKFFSSNPTHEGIGQRGAAANVGDFNQDGRPDLAIGAPFSELNLGLDRDTGVVFVIFDVPGLPRLVDLDDVGGSLPGFQIAGGWVDRNGEERGAHFGYQVASMGDFDGDGYDDLSFYSHDGANRSVYMVYGYPFLDDDGLGRFSREDYPGRLSQIEGPVNAFNQRRTAMYIGDVNRDGFADVVIGHDQPPGSRILFGRRDFPDHLTFDALARQTTEWSIAIPTAFGSTALAFDSAAQAGDVDRDGVLDFLLGSPSASVAGVPKTGEVFLIYGNNDFEDDLDLGTGGFRGVRIQGERRGDLFGTRVSSAGDFNGDGVLDVLALATAEGFEAIGPASVYVIFGTGGEPLPLSVRAVEPAWGPLGGGTTHVVHGNGFTEEAEVYLGESPVRELRFVSDSTLEIVTAGAASPGCVSVRVHDSGVDALLGGGFEYTPNFPKIDLNRPRDRGLVLEGDPFDQSFKGLSTAFGDVSGDGIDDLAIGSYGIWRESGLGEKWMVSLIFGDPDIPVPLAVVEPSEWDAVIGTKEGADNFTLRGAMVAVLGDVDGDGLNDLGIGATEGKGYVLFGRRGYPSVEPIVIEDELDSGGAVLFDGGPLVTAEHHFLNFAPVGDLDGDGRADLAISFPQSSRGARLSGELLYFLGRSRGDFPVRVDLGDAGNGSARIRGSSTDELLGLGLHDAGDVNGDGVRDLLAGTWITRGQAYIVYGRAWEERSSDSSIASLVASSGATSITILEGIERFPEGFHFAPAGDVNADGYSDVLFGAEGGGVPDLAHQGVSYVVFGSADLPARLEIAEAPEVPDHVTRIFGSYTTAQSGKVQPAGDFNSDGFDDFLVISPLYADVAEQKALPGRGYLILGAESLPERIDLGALGGRGIEIPGSETNSLFCSLSQVGDLNADGRDDFTISGSGILSESAPTHVYVVFGSGELSFVRGDCNGDGRIDGDVSDAVFLLVYNFLGGQEPDCLAACDADGDGQVEGVPTDAIYLLIYNFLGGPPPPSPFPGCGAGEPSDELLGCEKPTRCERVTRGCE